MQKLAKNFVVAADEVWRLQNRDGPECRLFKSICEEGHYGGRKGTRQGTYAFTVSGTFLASANTNNPDHMARMLRRALEAWKKLPRSERVRSKSLEENPKNWNRGEHKYPEDGLVLEIVSRDVDRPAGDPDDWRTHAWNRDWAWFRKNELEGWLPKQPSRGKSFDVSEKIVRRLARLHFVDNVRGQTLAYENEDIERAELCGTVKRSRRGVLELEYEGATKATVEGEWRRGIELKILGRARYDVRNKAFLEFELVAVGTRYGRTRYNFRKDDTEPAPIGIAARLSPYDPPVRTAPAFFWKYGWK